MVIVFCSQMIHPVSLQYSLYRSVNLAYGTILQPYEVGRIFTGTQTQILKLYIEGFFYLTIVFFLTSDVLFLIKGWVRAIIERSMSYAWPLTVSRLSAIRLFSRGNMKERVFREKSGSYAFSVFFFMCECTLFVRFWVTIGLWNTSLSCFHWKKISSIDSWLWRRIF